MALDKGEVIVAVDPVTGGEKEVNAIRMDLIPPLFLWELGRVYGIGANKYAAHNWRKGYAWSNSTAALKRHLERWLDGETHDEAGFHHLSAVAWHAATLMVFEQEHPELDDRFKRPASAEGGYFFPQGVPDAFAAKCPCGRLVTDCVCQRDNENCGECKTGDYGA